MNYITILVSLLLSVAGCERSSVTPAETGIVEGQVVIGPLCGNIPVETDNSNPCGFSDTLLDTIYSKYKVAIKVAGSNKTILKPVTLNHTGLFSFKVPVGFYEVEVIRPEGSAPQHILMNEVDYSKKTLAVAEGEVVKLTLEVSTDVR